MYNSEKKINRNYRNDREKNDRLNIVLEQSPCINNNMIKIKTEF